MDPPFQTPPQSVGDTLDLCCPLQREDVFAHVNVDLFCLFVFGWKYTSAIHTLEFANCLLLDKYPLSYIVNHVHSFPLNSPASWELLLKL